MDNLRAAPAPTPPEVDPRVQWREDFFVYAVEITALATGASTQTSIQIDGDSHFKWIETSYFGFDTAGDAAQTNATRVILPITMQVQDGSTGRNLLSQAVPLSMFVGEGDLPFFQPVPRIFAARSNFNVTFANIGAATFRFWVGFIGVKMFKGRQS